MNRDCGMIRIKSILEFSLLDWPGRVSSVIFLPGCNFRCPYCHNHPLVREPDSLEDVSLEKFLRKIRNFPEWIEGVVVSGGEPTIHPWLPDLLAILRKEGLQIKLDTNGSRPDVLADLIRAGLVDCIAMDVKGPLNRELYWRLAGVPVDLERIRQSIELLIASGVDHAFRTTVVPAWLKEKDIMELAHSLVGGRKFTLQNFRPEMALDRSWRSMKGLDEAELDRLNEKVKDLIHHRDELLQPSLETA
jgi:pyruvate formate lyase activating enzyme